MGINSGGITTHSFRMSGVKALANNGTYIMQLKSEGQWKSDKIMQHYVQNNDCLRCDISNKLKTLNPVIYCNDSDQTTNNFPQIKNCIEKLELQLKEKKSKKALFDEEKKIMNLELEISKVKILKKKL